MAKRKEQEDVSTSQSDAGYDQRFKELSESLDAKINSGFATISARLDALKPAEPKTETPADDPWNNIDEEIFKSPKETLKRVAKSLGDELRAEFRNEIQSTQQKTNAEQVTRDFWSGFWDANDDLNRSEDAVLAEVVLSKHLDECKTLNTTQIRDKLGDWVREEVLRIQRNAKRSTKSVELESGGGTSHPAAVEEEAPAGENTEKVQSITSILKERREARRKEK